MAIRLRHANVPAVVKGYPCASAPGIILCTHMQVPVFVPDTSDELGSLLKQMSAFGMGGWWLGGTHMVPNDSFLSEVQVRDRLAKPLKLYVRLLDIYMTGPIQTSCAAGTEAELNDQPACIAVRLHFLSCCFMRGCRVGVRGWVPHRAPACVWSPATPSCITPTCMSTKH